MAHAWKPVNDPPCRSEISCYSPDAQHILRILRQKYRMKPVSRCVKSQATSHINANENHYSEVYKQSFIKKELDDPPSPPIETEAGLTSFQRSEATLDNKVQFMSVGDREIQPTTTAGSSRSSLCSLKYFPGWEKLHSDEEEKLSSCLQEKNYSSKEVHNENRVGSDLVETVKPAAVVGTGCSTVPSAGSNLQVPAKPAKAVAVPIGQKEPSARIIPAFGRKRQLPSSSNMSSHHRSSDSVTKSTKRKSTKDTKKVKESENVREHGQGQLAASWQRERNIRSILSMKSKDERQKTIEEYSHASEVVMQLSYIGGDTQLRERTLTKKSAVVPDSDTPDAILLAVAPLSPSSQVLSVPLVKTSGEEKEWCQEFILSVMTSGIRKICYDAQDMMMAAMKLTQVDHVAVASKWLCLDPGVACWLLDPDNPPEDFSQLYNRVMKRNTSISSNSNPKEGTPEALSCLNDLIKLSRCMRLLYDRLSKAGLWNLFFYVEMPLVPILTGMEMIGIKVNPQKFHISSQILKTDDVPLLLTWLKVTNTIELTPIQYCNETRSSQLEKLAHEKAGKVFHLNSTVQLRQILFDELKLDEAVKGARLERTAGQNLKSTSENVLTKLQDFHPLPGIILEYRKMQKLKSTYVDGYLEYISGDYIHCTWEQTAAVSGRLQSTNPNIQNIPKQPISVTIDRGKGGAPSHRTLHMREPFVSREGYTLIAADFQSIELRLLAHFSDDELLLKVFQDEAQADIFVQMTSQWLGIPVEDVKDEDREKTKRIVYSVVYGAGSEKISEILNITKDKAKAFTKSFLDKFSGIKQFTQSCVSQCRLHGHVKSLLGRRRIIKSISSPNIFQKLHAERQAANFVIQGSAADVCKLAMLCAIREFAKQPHLRARLLIQIHDELLFEVQDDQVTGCKELIKNAMESVANIKELGVCLKIPLPVTLSVGKDWGHLVKC